GCACKRAVTDDAASTRSAALARRRAKRKEDRRTLRRYHKSSACLPRSSGRQGVRCHERVLDGRRELVDEEQRLPRALAARLHSGGTKREAVRASAEGRQSRERFLVEDA